MAKHGSELFDVVENWVHKWTPSVDVILDTSWAVWGDPGDAGHNKSSDVSFPGQDVARKHAHARAIILAMNPGDDRERGNWSNFHHSWKSRDQLLAEACRGTGLEGALMTDLFFDQFQSKSKSLDESGCAVGVRRILDIIEASGEEDPLILCLGGKTFKGFKKGLKELRKDGQLDVPAKVSFVQATHYSGSAGGKHKHSPKLYRQLAHEKIAEAGFGHLLQPTTQTVG